MLKKKKTVGSSPKIKNKKAIKSKPSKAKTIGAITLLALGLVIMPAGFILSDVVQDEIDKGVADYVVIPTPDEDGYDEWVSNDYDDAPETYRTFYLWNLVNPEEYLDGEKPIYEERGPYVFREYTYKYDIDFHDDDEEVTYKEYSTFEFEEDESDGDLDDKITNINPGFLGGRMLAGGTDREYTEFNFPMTLSTVREIFAEEFDMTMAEFLTVEQINNTLKEELPKMIDELFEDLPEWLVNLLNGLIAEFTSFDLESFINATLAIVMDYLPDILPFDLLVDSIAAAMPTAEEVLYEEWANDYFPVVDLDLEQVFEYLSNHPIEGQVIQDLLEELIDLIESSIDFPWWLKWLEPFVKGLLGFLNHLLTDLLDPQLLEDFVDFIMGFIKDSVIADFLEVTMEDMIRELGADLVDEEGSETGEGVDIDGREPFNYKGGSYADLNISTYNPDNGKLGSGLTQEQCHNLWDKSIPDSLTGMDVELNPIWFDALYGEEDCPARQELIEEFEINEDQLQLILDWINVSCSTWAPNVLEWTLNDWNSGPIVTRTAEEWIFTAKDKAIYERALYYDRAYDLADVGFFRSYEDEDEAEDDDYGVDGYTVNTGRGDIDDVGDVSEYDEDDKIRIWEKDIGVEGTLGTQFAPDVSEDDDLDVFNKDLMRTVELEFDEESEIYDIDLLRYRVSDDTFEPDDLYFQDIEGVANLETIEKYRDVPVRVTKPHFLDADEEVQEDVKGLDPDKDDHDTYVDVEPITGITMNARFCAQVNFDVIKSTRFMENISNTIMPILWMKQEGEITEELAETFKDLLYGALDLKENLPLISLAAGAALSIPGAALSTQQTIKRKSFKKQKKHVDSKLLKQKGAFKKNKLLQSGNNSKTNSNLTAKTKEVKDPTIDT